MTVTDNTSTDLRHMTSNHPLVHRDRKTSSRASQHLQLSPPPRIGSLSPNSIPSSPTSVHSSSSAIFERDIEPIVSPSPPHPHHPTNPHRIPRSKTTEQLDQSVPSVLDSAASILAGLQDQDHIAVVAPALDPTRSRSSGFASPIGSFRSRSPSPISSRPGNRTSLLLSIPHPPPIAQFTPGPRPAIQTNVSTESTVSNASTVSNTSTIDANETPSIVTPTSAYFSTTSSAENSPTTTTREHPLQALPAAPPPSAVSPTANAITNFSPVASTANFSPTATGNFSPTGTVPANFSPASTTSSMPTTPPSPNQPPTKRLSFMSYSDLLASTPASTLPLSSLTTSASSFEPPPHIPGVTGFGGQGVHGHVGSGAPSFMAEPVMGVGNRDSIVMVDDVGGEWEREGLGRGLEERLEALMPAARG